LISRKRGFFGVLALLVAVLALLAAGCGGDDEAGDGGTNTEATGGSGGGGVEALPSSSCTAVEYEGEGEPDVLIASDFPLQGSSRTQTIQIVEAIRYLLEQSNYKAGDHNVAYQSCDDATAQAGKWDSGKCSTNAQAYAGNEKVVGVIGTFNSGCAAIEIPVLNQAPGGGVAMISPANTYVCLTEGGPGCDGTEPDKYYPTGNRNYARVVAHDAYQGAAVAEFMQEQGVKSVYILNDKEAYGLGVATNLRNATENLGIETAGFEQWDPKASSYEALFNKVKQSGADAVFLGGLIDENGAQVIKDKVAVLGPNNGDVKLFAPDGFTTQQTIDEAGEAARDMFMSVAGVPIDEFTGQGAEFAEAFQERLGGDPIDPYAIYGAQAAQIMLDAIAASDGTRADVIAKMFEAEVTDGYLGSFSINENGDPEGAEGAVVGFTIYRATDKLETEKTISPKPENVEAARG
jgi:branched-chain amino acid transport system substrate-binding protein